MNRHSTQFIWFIIFGYSIHFSHILIVGDGDVPYECTPGLSLWGPLCLCHRRFSLNQSSDIVNTYPSYNSIHGTFYASVFDDLYIAKQVKGDLVKCTQPLTPTLVNWWQWKRYVYDFCCFLYRSTCIMIYQYIATSIKMQNIFVIVK